MEVVEVGEGSVEVSGVVGDINDALVRATILESCWSVPNRRLRYFS